VVSATALTFCAAAYFACLDVYAGASELHNSILEFADQKQFTARPPDQNFTYRVRTGEVSTESAEWLIRRQDHSFQPIFPRVIPRKLPAEDVEAQEPRLKYVFGDGSSYCAFPVSELLRNTLVGIFSCGVKHAASDRQVMFSYDLPADQIRVTTFVEDSSPADFDTGMLAPLLEDGQSLTLKSYTITKAHGVVSVVAQARQSEGSTGYAFWGSVKHRLKSGPYYRAGYGNGKAALFTSMDGKAPWHFLADVFSGDGKTYSEMDFSWRQDGTMFFICRENSGGSRKGNLYWAAGLEDGARYSAPVLYPNQLINGVQPQLRTLPDGTLLLMASDRTGSSGIPATKRSEVADTTGVVAWTLPKGEAPEASNWSPRRKLASFFSTDGGQPWPVVLPDGNVAAFFYARLSREHSPQIFMTLFDPRKL
jgi:hypothetical protein